LTCSSPKGLSTRHFLTDWLSKRLPGTPFCNRAILEQAAEWPFFDRKVGWTLPNTLFGDHVIVAKAADTAFFDDLVIESRPLSPFFDQVVTGALKAWASPR